MRIDLIVWLVQTLGADSRPSFVKDWKCACGPFAKGAKIDCSALLDVHSVANSGCFCAGMTEKAHNGIRSHVVLLAWAKILRREKKMMARNSHSI